MQTQDETNLYEQERRQKRQKLDALRLDPYGKSEAGLKPLAHIKRLYRPEMGHIGGPVVKCAGRVILKRDMGKLSFLTLRDESGELQVGLDRKRLDDAGWNVRGLIDLGDLIVIEGPLGCTNKGETTIWADRVAMAAKALLPPPAKWEGLSDVELRYRQRYVDLWANPDVMRVLKLRMAIVDHVRWFMKSRGFLEVETPMMQAIPGGAAARPFVTHHNALDIPLYLRIAPELFLKRLLVGGFSRVFELNRNFRNEGISPRHNPEFTMLEAYEAFGNWETMADMVEAMICSVAANVEGLPVSTIGHGNTEQILARAHELWRTGAPGSPEEHWFRAQRESSLCIEHRNAAGEVLKTINLTRPWRRVRLVDLVAEWTRKNLGEAWVFDGKKLEESPSGNKLIDRLAQKEGRVPSPAPQFSPAAIEHLRESAKAAGIDEQEMMSRLATGAQGTSRVVQKIRALSAAEQLVTVYEKLIEPELIDPCFVTHFPSVIVPLARENKDDPFFCDVYELAINGQEISPGYTELNDPDMQAKHFSHQVGDDAEKQKTDDDFLTALKYGMPPAGGIGLGIDRLVMMLTGAESIRDVILFPLMKPHEGS